MTLYGNSSVQSLIKTLASSGRFGHAYLFCGADGLGKKTFARFFAKAILCRGEPKPCGVCSACRKIEDNTHPDVRLWEEETKSGMLSVGFVRDLRRDCAILPNESAYKIYLIPHIERMNDSAFNALLKTLEEPPRHVIFLLTAPNPEELAETVLSRVVPLRLSPLSSAEMDAFLTERFPKLSPKERQSAALFAEGNPGLAVSYLSDKTFLLNQERVEQFCKAVQKRSDYELLKLFATFERDKKALDSFLEQTLAMLRLALRKRAGAEGCSLPAVDALSSLSEKQMLQLTQFLAESREGLSANTNFQLTLLYLTAEICRRIQG